MKSYTPTQDPAPTVTFFGAARTVTGSMHLLEVGPYRVLLDCGLSREAGEESRQRNRTFPFDPTTLDAVILSHAHNDHNGNLPNLVRQGFRGPIYCTPATRDLTAVTLADTVRIQEEDARTSGIVGKPERQPLYTRQDVHRTLAQCQPLSYGVTAEINPQIQLRFTDAGHILGSAITALVIQHAGREWRLTFTGDLGRFGLPFLRDPSPVPPADLLICESTYGGKTHDSSAVMAAKLAEVVRRTVARGGKVLIPAFSLGRTQIVVHFLREWMRDGTLPVLPIYIDSPLAADIAAVHQKYPDAVRADEDEIPAEYLPNTDDGRERTQTPDPCVIVASGGMCDGGRIMYHLRQHIDDPRSSIVLVSYQAPNSVGARLLEMKPTVRFHGRNWNKWIEVAEVKGFSGHADQNDFLRLLGSAAGSTGQMRLVHGEPAQAEALASSLRNNGFADVDVPQREETVKVA
jgi:metallo-beta-lactamase family protein